MTVAFTYFFRDLQTLELTVANVLPTIQGRRNIQFWDAGCATGCEPYTLAILCAEKMGYFSFRNLRILATDIDTSDLFETIITKGEYKNEEVQRIPPHLLEKYFSAAEDPQYVRIADHLRKSITFRKHDLLTLQPAGSEFSLIVCKNVLLHFSLEDRIKVLKMFHSSLSAGGFLATEHTQKLPEEAEGLFTQISGEGSLFVKR